MATSTTPAITETPAPLTSPSEGPLADLYSNPYGSAVLKYPSNLGDAQHPHMVVFTAYETQPAGYDEKKDYSQAVPSNTSGLNVSGATDIDEKTTLTFQPKRTLSNDVIALYMPDSLSFGYAAQYSAVSLLSAAKEVAGAVGGAIDSATGSSAGSAVAKGITSAIESDTAKLGLAAAGMAINPQQQLLFDSIDFRQYSMAFTFTPKNSKESNDVYNIIKKFRYHAAPQLNTGAAAMMFNVPDSFVVQFVYLNSRNQFVTRVKESVLTSVEVNYAPNGIWSTFSDGAPTQITMNLTFKEIALVDKTAIKNGF